MKLSIQPGMAVKTFSLWCLTICLYISAGCGSIDSLGLENSQITSRKVGDLSGVVVDNFDQSPIFGATVRVANLVSVTGANGNFFFQNISTGSNILSVTFEGYQP